MKKKIIIPIAAGVALIAAVGALVWPTVYDNACKNRVYSDLEEAVKAVESSNIRVISVREEVDDNITKISYFEGASGVIVGQEDEVYYALTAYHVVNAEEADRFIVATTLTPSYEEFKEANGISGPVVFSEYYDLMAEATVEYTSEAHDLAIISFRSDDELAIAELSQADAAKGDRLVAIGNPADMQGNFVRSYGKITSTDSSFETDDGQTTNKVQKHNAYVSAGSSGGAVFSEQMKLIGINIGGGSDILKRFRYGAMIPTSQIREFLEEFEKTRTELAN